MKYITLSYRRSPTHHIVLAVALYDHIERLAVAYRNADSMPVLWGEPIQPSRLLPHFPALRIDLERALQSTGNAMSVITLGYHEGWCNSRVQISVHVDWLAKRYLVDSATVTIP